MSQDIKWCSNRKNRPMPKKMKKKGVWQYVDTHRHVSSKATVHNANATDPSEKKHNECNGSMEFVVNN